ncbi:MAG: hypothetical protein OXB88_06915 [Bacteriovoracales bacterium]|nr:hypothetical protein [Bacteriovoracales bacterium]
MKVIIFSFSFLMLFFLPFEGRCDDVEERRNQILEVITEELKEVTRISRQYRHRKPELLLRMGELQLEKARLLKDQEQKKYLEIPPKKRRKISRKRFFSNSRKYFSRAQKICLGIIRKFPRFKLKSEVYYILAFNSKEFGKNRDSEKYFSLARRHSRKGSNIYKKASLALAEFNYNDKSYRKALSLYESGMRGKKDKWWTKDAFNMAWVYYRRGKFSKAISLMKEIYRQSENPKFIDMREKVKSDIGLFYVSANRLSDGIEFYQDLGIDIYPHLYDLGKLLMDQKKYTEAVKVLLQAKKGLEGDKLIDANLTLLNLFEKSGRYHKHFKLSQEIYEAFAEGDLEDEKLEAFLFQLKKVSGVLQKKVLKGAKKNRKNRREKADLAGKYFDLIAKILPKEKGKYLYLKAETYYGSKLMEKAIAAYRESFYYERERGNKKQMRLSLEGMMAALAYPGLSKKIKEKHYIQTYNAYLKVDRKSKKAEKIYQKIFQSYFDKKDLENAENVLKSYKIYFPNKTLNQEAMLAKIMEHYRKSGDRKSFYKWVQKIRKGEYRVSKKYAKQLSSLLLTMQFESVEKSSMKGDKASALRGYLKIFSEKLSGREAKINAAHNIAILYSELGYADKAYEWGQRTVSMMSSAKLLKFATTYLAISSELFNMQRFEKSAKLSEKVYRKICMKKSKEKNSLYKNSYIVYLVSKNFEEAVSLVKSGVRCGVSSSVVDEAHLEILKILGEQKRWKSFERYLDRVKRIRSMKGEVIYQMSLLRDAYKKFSGDGKAAKIEREMEDIYRSLKRSKKKISVDSLFVMAKIRLKRMRYYVRRFDSIKLEFPEKKFNALLEKKISMLEKVASEGENVFQTKSGKGSMKAYRMIIQSYQKLIQEIKEIELVGMSDSYIKNFRKGMKAINNALRKKSLNYLKSAQRLIAQGNVLSTDNYWFISKNRLQFNVEYHFPRGGVLMDRRGRR